MGRTAAAAYLARMGIPDDLAKEALADYEESEGAELAARKRLRAMRGLSPEVRRRRLCASLQRKGYSAETIRKVLKNTGLYEED